MDAKDILSKIKAMDLAELPPDTAVEVFSKMLEGLQDVLDGDTLLKFMMLISALYRNSTKSTELQI
ncbi:MAG TPA: hypothetical protein VJ654_11230, partial [Noviherbaspirillum sp.]|nr:hypothetical protein [Noviherbaspirillum sp.]